MKNKVELKKTIYYLIIVIGWGILSLVASQFIVGILMGVILGSKFSEPFWTMIYYALNYALAIALVAYVLPRLVNLCRRQREKRLGARETSKTKDIETDKDTGVVIDQPNEFSAKPDEMGLDRWPNFVDIGLAPIGYIVYLIAANFASKLMSNFSWFNADEAQDVGFSGIVAGSNRVWAILAIVFLAPIAEEIIMRGWLYGKVRKKLPIWGSILLVSAVFGIMHGQWNAGVATFALSLVLCGMREITGGIWSGMLLHILSNGIAFYILYIANTGIM